MPQPEFRSHAPCWRWRLASTVPGANRRTMPQKPASSTASAHLKPARTGQTAFLSWESAIPISPGSRPTTLGARCSKNPKLDKKPGRPSNGPSNQRPGRSFSSKNTISIAFENNGPKINQKEQDLIFKKFYTTKKKEGTGLGLGIVKNVVDSHQANISLKSNDDSTSFTISFKNENMLDKTTDSIFGFYKN